MFRRIRIAVLLLVLLFVVLNTWTDSLYTTRWTSTMTVALFPINADGSDVTHDFIANLTADDFREMEKFFTAEIAEYGKALQTPLQFTLAPELHSLPPTRPDSPSGLAVVWWSLKTRYWAWRNVPKPPGPTPRIRLFLLYHDPAKTTVLNHSTALKKGLIGFAHLFASQRNRGSNLTVIAHELLHTVGATDKYDMASLQPLYPDGFAEPEREPRYPQRFAELMAGRIAESPRESRIPTSLGQVLIGPATAREIGWLDAK